MKIGLIALFTSLSTGLVSSTTAEAGCFGKRNCCTTVPVVCLPATPGPPAPHVGAPPIAQSQPQGTGIMITEQRTQNYTVMSEVLEQGPGGSIIRRFVPETRTRTFEVTREATPLEVVEMKVDKLLDHYDIAFP